VIKADAIETHEYWDLTIKHYDTWLAHRHVRMIEEYPYLATKPWFIGEFGSDGVNKGEDPEKRSGWRDRDKLAEDEYIRQIEIYRHGDSTEGVVAPAENVMAVFLFQQGAPPHMWQGWETRGTKLMDYMKSTWEPTHGWITGKVTDAEGNPLAGASVTVSPAGKKTTTDARGVYWLFALGPGKCTVSVASDGCATVDTSVRLEAGDIKTVDAVLKTRVASRPR
jgi:hypothetical protein